MKSQTSGNDGFYYSEEVLSRWIIPRLFFVAWYPVGMYMFVIKDKKKDKERSLYLSLSTPTHKDKIMEENDDKENERQNNLLKRKENNVKKLKNHLESEKQSWTWNKTDKKSEKI